MYRKGLLCFFWLLAAMTLSAGATPSALTGAPSTSAATLQLALAARSDDCGVAAVDSHHREGPLLDSLYAAFDYRFLWRNEKRYEALIEALDNLVDDGLDPAAYGVVRLRQLRDLAAVSPGGGGLAGEEPNEVCRDLLASRAYLTALHHLNHGVLDGQALEPLWRDAQADVADFSPASAGGLAALAREGLVDVVAAFQRARPDMDSYHHLRAAHAHWRERLRFVNWPEVPPGVVLKPGMDDVRVSLLRSRLAAEGLVAEGLAENMTDSAGDTGSLAEALHFDDVLAKAVEDFQRRHRLKVDGIVGGETRRAMNLSRAFREDQIRANLERLRWLWQDMAPRMVLVDIAGASVSYYQGGEPVWQARAQVGMGSRPTPALKSRITHLTFNPPWTVPPTIYRQDKLPAIRKDIGYLAKNHIRVLDRDGVELDPHSIDWHAPGAIVLRQDAGPTSALGRVAFRFPNPFAVYLHDTPTQQLFASHQRAFSSGCVRVESAMTLADLLFVGASDEELARIAAIKASGRTRNIDLPSPVPLVMAYMTASVDGDGALEFRPDIYRLDDALVTALRGAER